MSWLILKHGIIDTLLIVIVEIILSIIFSVISAYLTRIFISNSKSCSYIQLVGEFFVVSITFGITGIVSGFLTGISRSPAVTALIPAILALFGSCIIYLISKGIQTAILAGTSITVFSVSLLLGTIYGSLERQQFDVHKDSLSEKLRAVDHELVIKTYRKSLGLPDQTEGRKAKTEDERNSEKEK